jgi:hypothetical protein
MTAVSDNPVLEIVRVFDAPPTRVFAAWLDHEGLQKDHERTGTARWTSSPPISGRAGRLPRKLSASEFGLGEDHQCL